MTRTHKAGIAICIGIAHLMFYGCGSVFPIRAFSVQTARGNPAAEPFQSISVHKFGEIVGKPYQICR